MEGQVPRVLQLLHFSTHCQTFLWSGNEGRSKLSTGRIAGQGCGKSGEKCKHGKEGEERVKAIMGKVAME